MGSRLVNVRLDEEGLRKVKALRESGVSLSELVRAAIDESYDRAVSPRGPRDVKEMFARLDAAYPLAAAELPPREYDVHDRRQAAAAVRARLDERRRRSPVR